MYAPQFHPLFPRGHLGFNKRARLLGHLLETNLEIFQVAEHNENISILTCSGRDTEHEWFEQFEIIKITVDNLVSVPVKSIINVEVL